MSYQQYQQNGGKKLNNQTEEKKLDQNICITFKNMYKQQRFDFPYEIVKYILANSEYEIVKKLYYTCKYFPFKFRLYLIDLIQFTSSYSFKNPQKRVPRRSRIYPSFKDKVWIGNEITTGHHESILWWMPKIERCTIKSLRVGFENLLWNDFQMLAKAGTIESVRIKNIIDSGERIIILEEICAVIPNVTEFYLGNTHVTPNTMKEVSKILKSTKIKLFNLGNVDNPLNAEDYLKFIQKYGYRESCFLVCLCSSPAKEKQEFFKKVNSEIKRWIKPKPCFVEC